MGKMIRMLLDCTRLSALGSAQGALLILAASGPFLWLFAVAMLQSSPRGFPYAAQVSLDLATAAGLLATGAAHRVVSRRPVAADVSCSVLLAVSCVSVAFSDRLSDGAMCAMLALGGLGLAWLSQRAFGLCCRLGIGDAYRVVLLSFALAALVRFALVAGPSSASLAVVVALGCCCTFFLVYIRHIERLLAVPGDGSADAVRLTAAGIGEAVRCNAAFLVEIAACALVLGLFMGRVEGSGGLLAGVVNHALRLFVALYLLYLFDARVSRRSYGPAQTALFVAMLATMLAVLFGGAQVASAVAGAAFSLGRNVALLVVYLTALHAALAGGVAPGAALGCYRGAYELVQAIGVGLDMTLSVASLPALLEPYTVPLISSFVLLIVVNRLITFVTDVFSESAQIVGAERLDGRVAELAAERDLTPREAEVMRMLAAGRTRREIADDFAVSTNTVRWHVQNVYEKLGVHTREELVALLGEGEG